MIGIKEGQGPIFAQFAKLTQGTSSEPPWLRALRQTAMDQFAALGFPTKRNDDWKYTDIAPIVEGGFTPAEVAMSELEPERIAREKFATLQCKTRLVFVNGFFSETLSSVGKLPKGVKVTNLLRSLHDEDGTIGSHLGRYARSDKNAFAALNTALFQDGAFVEVPKGCILDEPILVVCIALPGSRPVSTHLRNVYLLGEHSQATIIESFLSLGDDPHFTNVVSELVAAEGAILEHYKLQQENEAAYHVATIQAIQERRSHFISHNISFGGALTRNDINVVLDAEDAECDLGGLFVASGKQHIDNQTTIDHAKPNCMSRELYKGILGGHGAGVFNGKILVREDAQKTNAAQNNNNLLLSDDATINTKPELEIYADDVRCQHGATVGQISQDAVFYMRARGISKAAALDLLTYAFAGEVFDSMKWVTVRSRLEQVLFRKLAKIRQDSKT